MFFCGYTVWLISTKLGTHTHSRTEKRHKMVSIPVYLRFPLHLQISWRSCNFQLLIPCTAGIPVMGWAKSCSSPPPSPSPFPTTAFCSPHPYSPSKTSLKGARSVLLGVSGYLACEYSRLTLGVSWVSREKCMQFKPKNSLLMMSICPEFRHCFRMATLLHFLYN